ncbi:MAG: Ig-like domain-containing protein [bacterium]
MKSGLFVSLLKYRRNAHNSSLSSRARRMTRNVQRVVLAAAALACGETPTAPSLIAPTPLPTQIVQGVRCVVDTRTRQMSCDSGEEGSATATRSRSGGSGINIDLVVGGQNTFIKLTSSNVTYSGDVYAFTTTVQNLIPQSLGTNDGTTLDPSGVRVFFEQEPVFTSGSGTIDFVNPVGGGSLVDGFATFTRANQPYYQYNQILHPNDVSAGKLWRMHVPATVTSFAFTVYVSAPVQYPTGWIDVTPAATVLQTGGTQQLTAVVRDAVGRVQAGAPVTWASLATAVATVDPSTGLVTAVGDGAATIEATSTTRTGRALITVATPTLLNINSGDGQTALVGAAEATPPSVIVLDQNGVGVPNVQVTFSVTGGGGSATGLVATTNASGIATVGSWTLGAGGAGCSAAAVTNCSRNTLHAVATGGAAPTVDIKGYIPPIVPATATYQAVGNATLPVAANIGVLLDAFSINGNGANGQGATLTVTTPSPSGSQGGTVTIASDGGFSYLSSPTYVSVGAATESFTFTVSDGIASIPTGAALEVNVPEHVWYVQPGYSGTSTGSDVGPFKDFSITAAQGVENVAAVNDTILVLTGSGLAAGGALKGGQFVYGQGASAPKTFTTGSAATYRNGATAITLLAAPSASPQIGALTLAANNNLRGMTLVGASGTALTGAIFGTLTVGEVIVNAGANAALNLSTGTLSGSFTSVSSGGGTNNISLNSLATSGTAALGTGALAGATSDAVRIQNGAGTFTYSGSVANTTALAANITGMSGGGVTLSGNINTLASPGAGLSVTGNTGGAFTFSGSEIGISSGATTGINIATNSAPVTIDITPSTALQIATTSGIGFNASGSGTLTVLGANTINSTAATAVNLNLIAIGAGGFNFSSVTSAGGSSNVALTNVGGAGAIALGGGALSAASGTSFALNGGTNAVTYNGTIAKVAAGQLILLSGHATGNLTFGGNLSCTTACGSSAGAIVVSTVTSGTITFSGGSKVITSTAAGQVGVLLQTNSVATLINFTGGGLAIQTSTGNAFNAATTGGTITVQGAANTLTSTTGTALNVVSSEIGAAGMTFRSVSANGGSNGIVLSSTGATGGGLTVTGDGSAASNASGGTIQNMTGSDGATAGNGVYLSSTRNVSLNQMNFAGMQNNGVFATAVRGFSIDRSRFTGTIGNSSSGSFDESPIHLVDIGGGVSLKNSRFDGGAYNGAIIENITGTAPTLDSLIFAFDTVSTMQGSTADVRSTALLVNLSDGSAPNIQLRNNQVTAWWGNAIHVLAQGTSNATTRILDNFADNTNGALAGAGGIWVAGGTHTYRIAGNTVRHTNGTAISADRVAAGSTMQGTIESNAIGLTGDANSGSFAGLAIFGSHHGTGTTSIKIANNTIKQVNPATIGVMQLLTGDALGYGGSGAINATVRSNSLMESGTGTPLAAHMAMLYTIGTQSGPPIDVDQACLDIGGAGALANTISGINTGSPGASPNRIRVNQRFATTSRFPGYTGTQLGGTSSTDLAAYLLGRNTASNSTNANTSTGGFNNTSPAGSACPQPTALP